MFSILLKMKLIIAFFILLLFAFSNSGKMQSRILNGVPGTSAQFPYYVFLEFQRKGQISGCGASLISDEWIITAAHCLNGKNQIMVHLGKSQLNQNQPGSIQFIVKNNDFYLHPRYKAGLMFYDIGEYFSFFEY